MARSQPSSLPCHYLQIFDLPPELRNKIYELVLIRDYSFIVTRPNEVESPPLREKALTQVSRRMRSETLPICYGGNTFQFWVSGYNFVDEQAYASATARNLMAKWAQDMCAEAIAHLRSITFLGCDMKCIRGLRITMDELEGSVADDHSWRCRCTRDCSWDAKSRMERVLASRTVVDGEPVVTADTIVRLSGAFHDP